MADKGRDKGVQMVTESPFKCKVKLEDRVTLTRMFADSMDNSFRVWHEWKQMDETVEKSTFKCLKQL